MKAVILTDLKQYRHGCEWLLKHAGKGKVWEPPPSCPNKSYFKWWSNVYGEMYIFWIKDEHVKTLFLLSLPAPTVYAD